MKKQDLENKPAGRYAYAAVIDAQSRAANMWSHYSQAQRTQAERMKLGLELCYYHRDIHINPRKKFISVKVENARVRDRANLQLLEADYERQGIKKVVTDQGVTYRILKND